MESLFLTPTLAPFGKTSASSVEPLRAGLPHQGGGIVETMQLSIIYAILNNVLVPRFRGDDVWMPAYAGMTNFFTQQAFLNTL